MLNSLKRLTDGMIIYSVTVSDFEKLDFKNDALAGVRANYFNSNNSAQHDRREVILGDKTYNLSYSMCSEQPLSWKVTKDKKPYQSVKIETGGVYCVLFYGENGTVYKRAYFSKNHNWIRTEYFDAVINNKMLCRIYPKNICGIVTLQLEKLCSDGTFSVSQLFPSGKISKNKCSALVYSNAGMLWYDESYRPNDLPADISFDEQNKGFDFKISDFDISLTDKNALNLTNAEYLEPEDCKENNEEVIDREENKIYSAYDKIGKILEEAHKTNKDIFGEVINYTSDDEKVHDSKIDYENEENNNSENEESQDNKNVFSQKEIKDGFESELNISLNDNDFENKNDPPCDIEITTKSGRYSYYGNVDENNCRTGRGRTVSPLGLTAYDGEYKNNLRCGFGVCYYKGGQINYVGSWKENNRSGGGVGYRLSDGTMHAGKWENNVPCGYGARFDNEGNFIDVCSYDNGVRNGLSVSFDDNGNVIISKWINGEKVFENAIKTEDFNSEKTV